MDINFGFNPMLVSARTPAGPVADTIGYAETYLLETMDNAQPSVLGRRADAFTPAQRLATVFSAATYDQVNKKFGPAARTFNAGAMKYQGVPLEQAVLNTLGARWSYEFQIRPTANAPVGEYSTIYCVRDDQISYNSPYQILYALYLNENGRLSFVQSLSAWQASPSGGTVSTIDGATVVTLNTYHHARVVLFGGFIHLYLDGVEQGTPIAHNGTNPGSRFTLHVGCTSTQPYRSFLGQIDDWRICTGAPNVAPFTPPTAMFTEFARFEKFASANNGTISAGDTVVTQTGAGVSFAAAARAYLPRTTKSYWEMVVTGGGGFDMGFGLAQSDGGNGALAAARAIGGTGFIANGPAAGAAQITWGAGRMMGAYDPVAGLLWVGQNNIWFSGGNPATGANPYITSIPLLDYMPWVFGNNSGPLHTATLKFSSANISYAIPAGFSLLVPYP